MTKDLRVKVREDLYNVLLQAKSHFPEIESKVLLSPRKKVFRHSGDRGECRQCRISSGDVRLEKFYSTGRVTILDEVIIPL